MQAVPQYDRAQCSARQESCVVSNDQFLLSFDPSAKRPTSMWRWKVRNLANHSSPCVQHYVDFNLS